MRLPAATLTCLIIIESANCSDGDIMRFWYVDVGEWFIFSMICGFIFSLGASCCWSLDAGLSFSAMCFMLVSGTSKLLFRALAALLWSRPMRFCC